ncbi:MAG: hypothetical protein JW778_02310 [Candidatus Altiarchaeota archaeon]|nr:hypothetical protein [Candidatus Altiarchaeota archaeon]
MDDSAEKAFALTENSEEAKRYFESKRKKKILFLGSEERIDQIEKRYIPLGRFNVFREEKKKKGAVFRKQAHEEKQNTVYADLAHLELFYVKKALLSKPAVEHSDILIVLKDLPEEASDLLLDLIEFGSVRYEQLQNQLDEKNMVLLMQRGLIEAYSSKTDSVMGIAEVASRGYGYPEENYYVRSKIHVPKIEDKAYDLESLLKVDEVQHTTYPKDPVEHSSGEVSELLGKLFLAEAVFDGIVYLPYYLCNYLQGEEKSRQERYEIYFPLQFI